MSVLYSPTLGTDRIYSRKKNLALRSLFVLFIATFSSQAVFAQDQKEIQKAEETDLKQLAEKKISLKEAAEESAKLAAEKLKPSYFTGVDYRVITNNGGVKYVVTSAGREIFGQQINTPGTLYEKQVQAEKEAIYAYNVLRRNINYPISALQAELASLTSNNQVAGSNSNSRTQRITADYTFNGGAGTIPASPGTGTGTGAPSDPYPTSIAVSGVPTGALVKEIKINGLTHTFPDDIDIVLQSPSGTNVILMSDCGLTSDISNVNYTFSDGAAIGLSDDAFNATGTYKPTNFGTGDNWPAPGPLTAPSALTLSTFGNGNHNGTWSLYIVDDAGIDVGSWSSWSIVFTDPPQICFPIAITGQPSDATVCSGANGSFTVAATPNGVSYNWQVDMGAGFVYLTNGGVYSGVNAATLSLTNVTTAMNGYQYRVVITCSDGGLPEISNPATLTVLTSPEAPVVVPTPSSATICPGGNVKLDVVSSSGNELTVSSGPLALAIPDYSTIPGVVTNDLVVAGFPAVAVSAIRVKLNINHTFDGDLKINLKAPNGSILNLVNSRGGGGDNFVNTIINSSGGRALSSGSAPFTGVFIADAASSTGVAPYVSTTTSFSNLFTVPNGTWTLIISDHAGGDIGTLTSWSITILPTGSTPDNAVWSPATGLFNDAALTSAYVAGTFQSTVYASPASTTTYSASVSNGTCNSASVTTTVTVNAVPTINTQPSTNGNACIGVAKTFSVSATGTSLTYQWQVDMGGGFVNITSGTPANPGGFVYTGQTSATLSINSVMATMTGYKFRVIVNGTCTPSVTSNEVILTANARPVLSVTNSSECSPSTLTASGADTYSWSPSAGLSATTGATVTANPTSNTIYTVTGTNTTTGCTNTTPVDVKFIPASPVVTPSAPIICAGNIQQLSISSVTAFSSTPVSNTTNSGALNIAIADTVPPAISPLTVAGINGVIQHISVNFNIDHTFDGDLIINLKAPNGNIFNLVNRRGGGGDNFVNTTISSAATAPVSGGSAPFSGTYLPDGASSVGTAPNVSNVTAISGLYSTANGTWTLIVTDPAGGDAGILKSWSITITYFPPDAGIWTPVAGLFTDAAGTTPYVAGSPAATVYANPASTTTYSVIVTNTSNRSITYSSGGSVTIPGVAPVSNSAGAGAPYPSVITVAGLPANAVVKSVAIRGLRHSGPSDIDMLLQSPTGTNVVLMSDAGGLSDATGQTYTFDDAAAATLATTLNATGTYRPTNFGASDTYPAPIGAITQATPTLASFTGDLNGTWNLFVNDAVSSDIGFITSWEITFTIPTATNCTSAPRTVTVTVQQAIAFTAQPANRTACQGGTVSFTAAATGTITTTQWQVSTNGGGAGGNWTNIAGATTTTLTLTNVQPSQNGYKYRLVLTNAGCGSLNSSEATLTVNPLPTVSLSLNPAGQTELRPGLVTTVSVNSTPAGASYQWFVNGINQPGITTSSYPVDAFHLGTYTVRVTDVNGCINTTAGVTFTAQPTSQLFVYPNPTSGAYYVTYYFPNAGTPVILTVMDMKGRKMVERRESTSGAYTRFDFSADNLAPGVYIVQLRHANGDLLESAQFVVTR